MKRFELIPIVGALTMAASASAQWSYRQPWRLQRDSHESRVQSCANPVPYSRVAFDDWKADADEDVKILAGGQSLVPLLNMRMARPDLLVDLNRIEELQYIREDGDWLAIGAMTRKRAVEESDLVRRRQPVLVAATQLVAHPQIRNRGTVGGSMAHADPAAEYPALALALGVELRAVGPGGERTIGGLTREARVLRAVRCRGRDSDVRQHEQERDGYPTIEHAPDRVTSSSVSCFEPGRAWTDAHAEARLRALVEKSDRSGT